MIQKVTNFLAEENGATVIEYATITVLVSVGLISGGDMLGLSVDDAMSSVSSDLQAVT